MSFGKSAVVGFSLREGCVSCKQFSFPGGVFMEHVDSGASDDGDVS